MLRPWPTIAHADCALKFQSFSYGVGTENIPVEIVANGEHDLPGNYFKAPTPAALQVGNLTSFQVFTCRNVFKPIL